MTSGRPGLKNDDAASPRRRLTVAFIAFSIAAVALSGRALLNRFPHFREGFHRTVPSLRDGVRPGSKVNPVQSNFPPSLSSVITQPSGPPHLFTVPTLVSYYQDVLPNNYTKLYLVTSGIMMIPSRRNFTAVACQVGNDIYPASMFTLEVLHCEIPRPLQLGELLVPVLAWDDYLKNATRGPVKLLTGVIAELFPGDIEQLPQSAVLRGKLASANRDHFRVVRSDVRVGPSDNFVAKHAKYRPRFRLCLMTMVAPNSHMLKDWADYHRRIGVDHVYIFDNGAKRDLHNMFHNRTDVEIITWPYHKSQQQAISTFLFAARSRCERIMMEDSDEYAMFGLGEGTSWREGDPPLIRYAKKAEKNGFLHYTLLYILMVNSGFLHRPEGEVPTNFIHRLKRQRFRYGKSVCYTDLEWQTADIHNCGQVDGKDVEIYHVNIRKWGDVKTTPEDPDDPPFLVHFRNRSWEEFIEKWNAGRVAGRGVADERAGKWRMNAPHKGYMSMDSKIEYSHFRDNVYSRVLKEGTLDEQTIVQTINGRRCERLYRIINMRRELVHETCLRYTR